MFKPSFGLKQSLELKFKRKIVIHGVIVVSAFHLSSSLVYVALHCDLMDLHLDVGLCNLRRAMLV